MVHDVDLYTQRSHVVNAVCGGRLDPIHSFTSLPSTSLSRQSRLLQGHIITAIDTISTCTVCIHILLGSFVVGDKERFRHGDEPDCSEEENQRDCFGCDGHEVFTDQFGCFETIRTVLPSAPSSPVLTFEGR